MRPLLVLFAFLAAATGQTEVATNDTARNFVPLQSPNSNTTAQASGSQKILCGLYKSWSDWSRCSRRCQQTRSRSCGDPGQCGRSSIKQKRFCKRRKKPCRFVSYKLIGQRRRNHFIERLLYDILYDQWTGWSPCSRACKRKRTRKCEIPKICGKSYILQSRRCRLSNHACGRHYTVYQFDYKPLNSSSGSITGKKGLLVNNPTGAGNGTQAEIKQLVLPWSCGSRPPGSRRSYRIVGGREVIKHSWPWQVAIFTRNKKQRCGGTLIAPRWVLTAAHCVRKKGRRRHVIIRVGEHDLDEYDVGEINLRLNKDFPHGEFDYNTISNDIALLKLRQPVKQTATVRYACLPAETDEVKPGTMCYIVGWGKTKSDHFGGSNVLMEAKVPIVDQLQCQQTFKYIITENQICAGYKKGGVDSCGGDSGGPLICSKKVNETERWFVFGVTSYGEDCGKKSKYGIYTNVRKYLGWIYRTISEN